MFNRGGTFVALAVICSLHALTSAANAGIGRVVDLRLRSSTGTSSASACAVGSTVAIDLRAISDTTENQPMSAINCVINWDPTKLRLIGILDDASSTYPWLFNFFPDDRGIDRVNEDRAENLFWSEQECTSDAQCSPLAGCNDNVACTNEGDCRAETFCNLELDCGFGFGCCNTSYCNYTGFVYNDGSAMYQAYSQFCFNPPCVECIAPGPACATPGPNGLLITKFLFEAIATGSSVVSIAVDGGSVNSKTEIYDGNAPNIGILDDIGGPVTVTVGSIPVPTVVADGPRFFRVTPNNGTTQVALKVIGQGAGLSCVNHYVNASGTLQTSPVFRTGTQWGTIHVGDSFIAPSSTYRVESDCGSGASFGTTVTTYPWGDVDNTGIVDLDDLIRVLDGFAGVYGSPDYVADLMPCDRFPGSETIDLDDIIAVLDAFAGVPYSAYCAGPCGEP